MAAPLIRIEVITPERTVLWDRTESIIARPRRLPGHSGEPADGRRPPRGCFSRTRRSGETAHGDLGGFWKWRTIT